MPQMAASGIYEIANSLNGNRYIGSAVNLPLRWSGHRTRLNAGKHHNRHLQAAWAKYGRDAFRFRVLLICDRADVVDFEQRAITAYEPEYNVCKVAGSTLGVNHSAETRAKIAARALGRVRSRESVEAGAEKLRGRKATPEAVAHLKGNKHAVGLVHTEEWKLANSIRQTGMKRPKSPEYRAKISAALMGVPHSPERRANQAEAQRGIKRGPYRRKESE